MKIAIHAVGRMKTGPERELADRYLERAAKGGRALGITAVTVREVAESRAARAEDRKTEEATDLLSGIPEGAFVLVLDERGDTPTSEEFARLLRDARDRSAPAVALVIGGADGHGRAVLEKASRSISFGRMTWPHQIVRILAAEQIYRAITILGGHPYHRA